MKNLLRKITHPIYKRYHFWYHRKPRKYTYKNIYTVVQPSVFSPINTVSTKVFLDYIGTLELNNKTVLELGCGSGIISIFSACKKAIVTATDINKIAVDSLEKVSKNQKLSIKTIASDLFEKIENDNFDYIFINPPYYPKKPNNLEEKAWFCGENFEYFQQLFSQLPNYLKNNTDCLMILSEDCELDSIKNIASKNNLFLDLTLKKTTRLEFNYIFKITESFLK